ncbi:MAG: primase-helicase family protein, partial [Planctomycetota bacterium]
GVTEAELEKVREAARSIPWVECRKSTGGKGLHLYVYFAPGIKTETHTEHAAVARCILQQMSEIAGFDFANKVDVCGGNMWIWHRKHTPENEGLKLLKAATELYEQLPINWKRHVDVVSRRRTRVAVDVEDQDAFDKFTAASARVDLDDTHKRIIKELAKTGYTTTWVPDHWCLQTHTGAFDELFNMGDIDGVYQTSSECKDKGKVNCYAFPVKDGAFRIYRFGRVDEAPTWVTDKHTWCYFNTPPTFEMAVRASGGRKLKQGFAFDTATQAIKAIECLDTTVELPNPLKNRPAKLIPHGKSEIELLVERNKEKDAISLPWEPKRGGWWQLYIELGVQLTEHIDVSTDAFFRILVTPGSEGKSQNYCLSDSGKWISQAVSHAKPYLQAVLDCPRTEVDLHFGRATKSCWERVSLPFQDEFPGGRRWNKDAAQLLVRPTDEPGDTTHWDKILTHCGSGLDEALAELEWAKKANITTGADYLRALIACYIRCPFEPTPYLFLYGPENSGKSILWESLQLLMTGVVRAERPIIGREDNGELEGAIVGVLEEVDVTKSKGALERIKGYVTSPTILIRRLYRDAFMVPNTLHWIHTAQRAHCVPVFPGDTRITMVFVPELTAEIPKSILTERLRGEAPAFLRQLLNLELPPVMGRLRIPVVETRQKAAAQGTNATEIEQFITECCKGSASRMKLPDFAQAFRDWLPVDERAQWNSRRIKREFPDAYSIIQGAGNYLYIHGLVWKEGV